MKDFDTWNKQKKTTHEQNENKWCRERDIWWCVLGTNIGYEQDGKGDCNLRPVIVLKHFGKFTALVVPLTTHGKDNKYYVFLGTLLGKKSWAITTQIRLIDTKRLFKKESKIDINNFLTIKKAITELLR